MLGLPSAVLKASTVAWIDAALGPAAENVVETACAVEEMTTRRPATMMMMGQLWPQETISKESSRKRTPMRVTQTEPRRARKRRN